MRRILVASIWLLHLSVARADTMDLACPSVVYEGEAAQFYVRGTETPPIVEIKGKDFAFFKRVQGEATLLPGSYLARYSGPNQSWQPLHVNPLPPAVAPTAPLEKRTALIQIFVENGDRSWRGRVLEAAGREVGPLLASGDYAAEWVLGGRQATERNVRFAIDELARRGYVIDIFAAIHGGKNGLRLADRRWHDFTGTPGLRSVRLFYSTSCEGGGLASSLLAAGVRTYVAARGLNYVHAHHMVLFYRGWASRGERAQDASRSAFQALVPLHALRWVAERAGLTDEVRREGTRPIVFGDPGTSAATDLRASSPGAVGALERAR